MKNVCIEVKEEVFEEVNGILEDCGMDMEIAVKMFFKRLIKEGSMAFLMKNANSRGEMNNLPVEHILPSNLTTDRGEMRKVLAIRLFRDKGRQIGKTVTYSSKNRATYNYWANPSFSVLSQDWKLILNDWVNRKIYLFSIPKNSLSRSSLVARNDQQNLIDLQILEQAPGFIDKRSGVSFNPYLIDTIAY